MKDARFKLEFTTHVLANGTDADGNRDRFQKDSKGRLIWQQSWWYSALSQGISLVHGLRGVKAADIHMDLAVSTDTELYRRKYGDNKSRTHEAILPGTEVMFNAIVADHITQSILRSILDRVGSYVGLSPYGYKLGFGKFNVISVEVAPSDAEGFEESPPDIEQEDE